MTDTDNTDEFMPDRLESMAAQCRAQLAHIEQARDEQPARLAEAREQAERARTDAVAVEPWDSLLSAIPTVDLDGQLDGMLSLPNVDAKELFGTRLAFDLLGCCPNKAEVDEMLKHYLWMVKDPEHLFLIASAALRVIACRVMPGLLHIVEEQASRYDVRVNLVDAARNAWAARVNDLRGGGETT
jgi:hypothetical protein